MPGFSCIEAGLHYYKQEDFHMKIKAKLVSVENHEYLIRSAAVEDASELSALRLQLDGETENFDRVQGEGFLDEAAFLYLIQSDTNTPNNLMLVAEMNGKLVGYARCEGSTFKRLAHKVEFGVGVLQKYWGHGIGKNLIQTCLVWAKSNGKKKMTLQVLETNKPAIQLYKSYGFETEGILKKDKLLADGNYYNTLIMGAYFH